MSPHDGAPSPAEPWIGDETTEPGCRYHITPGRPTCGAPVTIHIISESAISGPVVLPTCDRHASIAKLAGPWLSQHTPGSPNCHCAQEDDTP